MIGNANTLGKYGAKVSLSSWKAREFRTQILWLIGVGLVVGIADALGMAAQLSGRMGGFLIPVRSRAVQSIQTIERPYTWLSSRAKSAARIQDLEIKYSQSLAQISELETLREENLALKALLENTDRIDQRVRITTPLVSLSQPSVSAGSSEGVRVGDLVIASGTLVGRVSETALHTSEIELMTHRDLFSVVVKSDSGVEGVIKGDGKRLLMTEVPVDTALSVGEKVVTVGQIGVPPGLLIGTVGRIEVEPASSSKKIIVDQVVNFYQAQVVEIYLFER